MVSAATKKIGTPIGTVIASACATEPVRTPRRALALLKANVAADSAASTTPSTRQPFVIEAMVNCDGADNLLKTLTLSKKSRGRS